MPPSRSPTGCAKLWWYSFLTDRIANSVVNPFPHTAFKNRHRVWLDEEVTGRNEVTTTFFYDWSLWCACSFSGCKWVYSHGTLLCQFSISKCGGALGGNDQNRAEKQNVVLTWFRPVTWSSGHLGRRKNAPNPKFVQNLSRRLFSGFQSGGPKFVKNLSKIWKFVRKFSFFKFPTNFWRIWVPLTGTPKNNRRDKFWTNLGFGAFLNAVRGKRVRKNSELRDSRIASLEVPEFSAARST